MFGASESSCRCARRVGAAPMRLLRLHHFSKLLPRPCDSTCDDVSGVMRGKMPGVNGGRADGISFWRAFSCSDARLRAASSGVHRTSLSSGPREAVHGEPDLFPPRRAAENMLTASWRGRKMSPMPLEASMLCRAAKVSTFVKDGGSAFVSTGGASKSSILRDTRAHAGRSVARVLYNGSRTAAQVSATSPRQ